MKPSFMRRHESCPDCGLVLSEEQTPNNKGQYLPYRAFDCPRCSAHYTPDEFYELNHDKYSKEADLKDETE